MGPQPHSQHNLTAKNWNTTPPNLDTKLSFEDFKKQYMGWINSQAVSRGYKSWELNDAQIAQIAFDLFFAHLASIHAEYHEKLAAQRLGKPAAAKKIAFWIHRWAQPRYAVDGNRVFLLNTPEKDEKLLRRLDFGDHGELNLGDVKLCYYPWAAAIHSSCEIREALGYKRSQFCEIVRLSCKGLSGTVVKRNGFEDLYMWPLAFELLRYRLDKMNAQRRGRLISEIRKHILSDGIPLDRRRRLIDLLSLFTPSESVS